MEDEGLYGECSGNEPRGGQIGEDAEPEYAEFGHPHREVKYALSDEQRARAKVDRL